MVRTTKTWQVQEAKQRFSELVQRALDEGPQVVTRHGREVVVVIDVDEYRRRGDSGERFKRWMVEGPKLDDIDDFDVDRSRDLFRDVDV